MSIRALTILMLTSTAAGATEATPQEVADFWNTVFKGAPPYGVPPLNASRTNPRMVGNVQVWDVAFDSYRDPSTKLPVRIGGYFALPPSTVVAPGPGGTYPGFTNTHSVGGCTACGSPQEGLDTAVYHAQKGYASLAFFVRGYGLSPMSDPADNSTGNTFICRNLPSDTQQPFNTSWTGYVVDVYQAGEFMAAQPEVWVSRGLSMTGHSLGGYVAAISGVFSKRYGFIVASAPPTSGSDIAAWMASGNPIASCIGNLPGGYSANLTPAIRMISFVGVYQAINSPLLVAKDATWKLDNTETFYYGGQFDTAVPAGDVQASYRRADPSNNIAFHWSPTGGHGGPESFYRMEAWFLGHYPGITKRPPVADLQIASQTGLTVTFSARASVANDSALMPAEPTGDGALIAYDYDFGDGTVRNWGDTVTYSYADAGTYTARVTVTDGEGLRNTAQLGVTVGGTAQVSILVAAPSPLIVDQGGSVVPRVSLSGPPGGTVFVNVARVSGDPNLSASPASLGFSDANWNVQRDVTLSAARTGDCMAGAAQFSFSGAGLAGVTLNAQKNNVDGPYSLTVGNAVGAPGERVPIDITLGNSCVARLRSLSVSLGYDAVALGDPTMVRGASVPGPAWWNFAATNPSSGTQLLSGAQVAQPEGAVVGGVIATDTFTIPTMTAPGRYPIVVISSAIGARADGGGGAANTTTPGSITVVRAQDGGPGDAGSGSGAGDAGGATDAGTGNRVDAGAPGSAKGGCGCAAADKTATWGALILTCALLVMRRGRRHAGAEPVRCLNCRRQS